MTFKPFRIFINHVDSYHGKKLVDEFSNTTYFHPENNTWNDEGEYQPDNRGVQKNYEVIGTLANKMSKFPENVRIISTEDKQVFIGELINCGYVIYDISLDDTQVDESSWSVKAIADQLETTFLESPNDIRHFILISSVVTWGETKQLNPKYPGAPFTEKDYAKRIPHKKFKNHIKCENDVLNMKERRNLREKFRAIVLCCGITYGDEEGPIHFLFKLAWESCPFLPIFGLGQNKIPLLHVRELSKVVLELSRRWPENRWYLVATELDLISQTTIVENISKHFMTQGTKQYWKADNSIFPEVTERDIDFITLDVNIEPAYTVDHSIQSDDIFLPKISTIIDEYKNSRNLQPMRICVLGPTASGKTTLAKLLAKNYRIPYVAVGDLIKQTILDLTSAIEVEGMVNGGYHEYEEVQVDEVDDDYTIRVKFLAQERDELRKYLDGSRKNLMENDGGTADNVLNKIIVKKLLCNECQNQGYVMDGYPQTLKQARELFGSRFVAQDHVMIDGFNDEIWKHLEIMPEVVILLEADDECLWKRVLNSSEESTEGIHCDVESMSTHPQTYREMGRINDTPLGFFIENGVYPVIVKIEEHCSGIQSIFRLCCEEIGEPRNYAKPTTIDSVDEAVLLVRDVTEILDVNREISEEKRRHDRHMLAWGKNLKETMEKEEKDLRSLSGPLHSFLVNTVLPTLTQALIEVVELRPDDPIDSIAQYLFRKNPLGRMLEETMRKSDNGISHPTNHRKSYKNEDKLNHFRRLENPSIEWTNVDCKLDSIFFHEISRIHHYP